jgi:hypothetical protein
LCSLAHWNGSDVEPIISEVRPLGCKPLPEFGIAMVDLSSKLKAARGAAALGVDPEHAGVQYRPANEIADDETVYYFPKKGADPREDLDYPWVGESYTVNDRRYSVVHMNHPDNPDGTVYSAYRDYGRFGAFSTHSIPNGETLTLNYRILIAQGEMPAEQTIQQYYRDYTGNDGHAVFELTGQGEKPWHTD